MRTVEEYAKVRAELEAGGRPEEILEREGLSARQWHAAERRWLAAIAGELGRGEHALADRYCAALGVSLSSPSPEPAAADPAPPAVVPAADRSDARPTPAPRSPIAVASPLAAGDRAAAGERAEGSRDEPPIIVSSPAAPGTAASILDATAELLHVVVAEPLPFGDTPSPEFEQARREGLTNPAAENAEPDQAQAQERPDPAKAQPARARSVLDETLLSDGPVILVDLPFVSKPSADREKAESSASAAAEASSSAEAAAARGPGAVAGPEVKPSAPPTPGSVVDETSVEIPVVQAEPLPFGETPSPEFVAALAERLTADTPETIGGETAEISPEIIAAVRAGTAEAKQRRKTLPFKKIAEPPDPAERKRLTLEQYASLCAELAEWPAHRGAILTRYRIGGEAGFGELESSWQQFFAAEPTEQQRFDQLLLSFRQWLQRRYQGPKS